MGAIDVNGVACHSPDGVDLLRDVSFGVGDGEHVSLVGANGVGKTTLFRVIAGDQAPAGGSVHVDGRLRVMRQLVGWREEGRTVRDMLLDLSPDPLRQAARQLRQAATKVKEAVMDAPRQNAIALLKADHRAVEELFREFKKVESTARKRQIAAQICTALKTHTIIEEEIFYPAFLAATKATQIHNEAKVEHAGATNLIEEIEAGGTGDPLFEAYKLGNGEVLEKVSKRFDVPAGIIMKVNGVKDARRLRAGQQLKMPRGPFQARIDISGHAGQPLALRVALAAGRAGRR